MRRSSHFPKFQGPAPAGFCIVSTHSRVARDAAASLALLLAVGLALTGCRFVGGTRPARELATEATSGSDRDGQARPAPRTIPLELVFVRCNEHDAALRDERG